MKNELHHAAAHAEYGFYKVKYLVEHLKANVNALHSTEQTKPVEWAAQSGSLETLKYLLEEAHVDLDASDSKHNLLYWALENSPDIMDYLTNPQHQLIKKFNDGTTELHAAVMATDIERIQSLLTETPDLIFATDKWSKTALYWAAYAGKQSAIMSIITHPAFHADDNLFADLLRGSADLHYRFLIRNASQDSDEDKALKAQAAQEAIRCYEQIKNKSTKDCYHLGKAYCHLARFHYDSDQLATVKENLEKACESFAAIADWNEKVTNLLLQSKQELKYVKHKYSLTQAVKTWGFKCKEVAEDGNCFFYAIALQLLRANPSLVLSHQALRQKTAAHIKANLSLYEGFIEGSPIKYLQSIQEEGTWADHITILACSRALNVNIVIIKSDDSEPQIFKRPTPEATLYVAYEKDLHYVSLKKITVEPSKNIQDAIDQAPVDEFQPSAFKRKFADMNNPNDVPPSLNTQHTLFAQKPTPNTDLHEDLGSPSSLQLLA